MEKSEIPSRDRLFGNVLAENFHFPRRFSLCRKKKNQQVNERLHLFQSSALGGRCPLITGYLVLLGFG